MRRGDVVLAVLSGDDKPRPAVIIQGDLLNELGFSSIVVCPLTSTVSGAPIVRVAVEPEEANGLSMPSEVMVEKVVAVARRRLRRVIGRLDEVIMHQIDDALLIVLGLA